MVDLKSWAVGALVLSAAVGARAQITDNPLPAPLTKRGLAVEVRDVVRLPETRNLRPVDQDVTPTGWARVSFVRDAPDGRRFANDSRGFLYIVDRGETSLVRRRRRGVSVRVVCADRERLHRLRLPPRVRAQRLVVQRASRARRRVTRRRRISSRRATARATSRFTTSSRSGAPTIRRASTFTGTRRELLRVAHVVQFSSHPMGAVEFNPTAQPGSPDYGLLYTSGSDLGFSNGGGPNANNPSATQRLGLLDHCDPAHRPAQPAAKRAARRASATTRFRPTTSSRPTATRRRSARSTRTVSATRTACRGTSRTARCSSATSA